MKTFLGTAFVLGFAISAACGSTGESKQTANYVLPPAPQIVSENNGEGVVTASESAEDTESDGVKENELFPAEGVESVLAIEGGTERAEAADSESKISLEGWLAEESSPSDSDGGSAFDNGNNYRDFVTRSEFEAAVSNLAWKKGPYTITPYGFLWADIAWNSSRCITDGYCLYSVSDQVDDTPGASVDARMTRLGAMIDGPGFPGNTCWKMKGVLEADFEGQVNSTRNKGQLQLRKAFIELRNDVNDVRFAFGQDWELLSPLAPQMLNYLPAGFAGNIGYRRCQFRVDKGVRLSQDCRTMWQFALADTFPGDYLSTSSVTAESGGWPLIEGRAAVTLGEKCRYAGPATFGVSAHIGEETHRFAPVADTYRTTSETKHIKTWSVNFDGDLPITKRISVQGEYFYGCDLSTFCGGINQGVDLYTRDGIRDQGGWLAFHTKVTDKLTNNSGYGIDKPFDKDLQGTSVASNGSSNFRSSNSLFFTNFLYQWNKGLMTGIELGYWKTEWVKSDVSTEDVTFADMENGETFRIDCAVQYLF